MELHVVPTGMFKLDGGAMFGVVPRSIWQKLNPPDDNHLCTWAMRCLLIEEGDRKILIDTGLGNKQSEKFFGYYHPHGEDSLEGSLKNLGIAKEEISDVILTHLHFDHCGGAVERVAEQLQPAFPNATYWSEKNHWESALNPNPREKASFLKENFVPLMDSGQLAFVQDGFGSANISFETFDGHTRAMLVPRIESNGKIIYYMADLLPSQWHIPLPWVMAYDVQPLVTLKEKAAFLEKALGENAILFFEHDPIHECGTLKRTEKGIAIDIVGSLSSLTSS